MDLDGRSVQHERAGASRRDVLADAERRKHDLPAVLPAVSKQHGPALPLLLHGCQCPPRRLRLLLHPRD